MKYKPGQRVIINFGYYGEQDSEVLIIRRAYQAQYGWGWVMEDATGERRALPDWAMRQFCKRIVK